MNNFGLGRERGQAKADHPTQKRYQSCVNFTYLRARVLYVSQYQTSLGGIISSLTCHMSHVTSQISTQISPALPALDRTRGS